MNRKSLIGGSLASLALVLSAARGSTEGAETPPEREYRSAGFHRGFDWREAAGAGQAQGLYLVDMVPAGMVQRVLVEDPAGRPVRITKTLDVRRGLDTCELLDDTTGWWARLDLDFGIQADSLGAFFAADEARAASGKPSPLRVRFAADGTSPVEVEVAATEPKALHLAVAEAVRAAAPGNDLVATMPAGLAQAILFFHTALSPSPLETRVEGDNLAYSARGVVEVLANVLRAAPPKGLDVERYSAPWPMTVRPMERGTSSSDPAVLELVSRFRSVENSDPLSDRPAAEAFGDPPPPI